MSGLRLNIGCGLTTPLGWLNIDSSLNARFAQWPALRKILVLLRIIPLAQANIPWPRDIYIYDVRRGLPFPDNSVEAIYCSHFLEHLSREDAQIFIKECYRLLDTKGIIRIIVPDLTQCVEEYIKKIGQIKQGILINELPAERFLEALNIFERDSINKNIFLRFYKKIIFNKNIHRWMYDEYALGFFLRQYNFFNIQRRGCYESLIKDIRKLDTPMRFDKAVCLEAQKL